MYLFRSAAEMGIPPPARSVFLRTICFGMVFAFLSLPLHAQLAPNTDSLKPVLGDLEDEDKRIRLLWEISKQSRRSDIDSALHYARRSVKSARRLDVEYLQAESHRILGRLLSANENNPEGLQHLLTAKRIYGQLERPGKEALTLENLGALYRRQGDYPKALEYYYEALNLRENHAGGMELANTLQNIGVINERLGQHQKAITFYERALGISEKYKNPSEIAINAVQLGNIFGSQGETGKALQLMEQALEASKRLPGEHATASILLEMSELHTNNQSYRYALDSNKKALELAGQMNDNRLQALALRNIAAIFAERGNFRRANGYLARTLSLFEKSGMHEEYIKSQVRIANNYLDAGNASQSIDVGLKALRKAEKNHSFEQAQEVLGILVEAYQVEGNLGKALKAQKKMVAVKESLFNIAKSRQIAEMQTRYDTKKKEQEIALLQKEKEQQAMLRNAFLAGLVLIAIIGLLVYNRQRLKIRKNKAELENTRLKERQLERDLEFKNKRLTTRTLHLVQKNESMKELKQQVREIRQKNGEDMSRALRKLQNMVDYSFNLDEDWREFRIYFEKVHSGFFEALKEQYPELTPNELRLSALAKLNLSIKETATIMGITPNSVKTARYRLRKKLDIETGENLNDFMMELERDIS